MSIQMNEKQKLIQSLLATKTKAYTAEFELLLKGKPDEAIQVKQSGKVLSKKIDALIAHTMSDWLGEAEVLRKKVRNSNKKIQQSISKIKSNISTANDIVKLVGLIDDVVEIAASLT